MYEEQLHSSFLRHTGYHVALRVAALILVTSQSIYNLISRVYTEYSGELEYAY